jgi:hypothetical protein
MRRYLLLLALVFLITLPARAQVQPSPIAYGQVVEGAITQEAFFTLWAFEALAGDEISATMTASGGLLPLLGVLDGIGNLVANSPDGTFDGSVTVRYTVPQDGSYALVATRVGRDTGTTTGTYTLALRLDNPPPVDAGLQDVTFRCQEYEVATALTIELPNGLVTPSVPYRINVYGLDGFQTLVRLTSTERDPNYCRYGNPETEGDTLLLPDDEEIVVDEALAANSFELAVTNAELLGDLTITIGSVDSAAGRFVAFITGLNIEAAGAIDRVGMYVGPLATGSDVRVYMVADDTTNSRIDPYLRLLPDETGCDDAGRRGCEGVPSLAGGGVRLRNEYNLLADRFDAGLLLRRDDRELQVLEMGSFSGNTFGQYMLVIFGELP